MSNKSLEKIFHLSFYFIPAMFIVACNPKNDELSDTEKQIITENVRQALHDYYSDIEKEGLTAEFKYLDSSENFFWVPPGYAQPLSYDSIAHIIKKVAPGFQSVKNTWDTLHIQPLSNTTAVYTGKLFSVMTNTAGNISEVSLIETGFLIKRIDRWKLMCGQTAIINTSNPGR